MHMQVGGWMGDLGRRVDVFFGFRYKSFGKRKTPYRRDFFLLVVPVMVWHTLRAFLYPRLAHLFLCIGPQLSLPHSVFLDLLVLLVGFLFVQRAFMCMRCVNVARAAASLGPQPPAHCTLTYIKYTREYCSPERRAVATRFYNPSQIANALFNAASFASDIGEFVHSSQSPMQRPSCQLPFEWCMG